MINFKNTWGLVVFLNVSIVVTFLFPTHLVSGQDQPQVVVSLQITSGVPNPSLVVTNLNDIAQLQQFINGLPNAAPIEEPPFGGFTLLSNEAISGFPQNVVVFNGVVKVNKADGTIEFFQDRRGLKGFLVNKAIENSIVVPGVISGDLDGDGDIDQDDINILLRDLNKPVNQSVCGVRCDLDGDGKITALDARKLTLLCTRPRCATK
jgi:hypothetical protein